MENFTIKGGNRLNGEVKIESAKNSVLPILAGSILTKEEVVIENCPKILDVLNMIKILKWPNVKCEFSGDNLIINSSNIQNAPIPMELTKELRASIFLLGSLVGRFNRASLCYPGGCAIGKRPIDIHINCLKSFGVEVFEDGDTIQCYSGKIMGKKILLKYPSVGATENAILVATLTKGKSEIYNCAREPEVEDLAKFLNTLGAKIYGAGTSHIYVEGVEKLHGGKFSPIGDRIETGTFMLATAICGGEVKFINAKAKNIYNLIHKFCDNTCKIIVNNDIIYMQSRGSRKSFSIKTGPYPKFPTDLQAQTSVLLAIADGNSTIVETVFENRFNHLYELKKMGADVLVKGKTAFIKGVEKLTGKDVYATDLRGGAALVLAGLVAEGQTKVYGVHHVARGYADFDKKLSLLGADIKLTDN